MSQLYSGDLLDNRYRIGAQIARGGMSTVYSAVDTRLDREVAVKVMDPALADQRSFRARFEREARAVAKLNHPALVNVFDQGVDGEYVFLVMELVVGGSLRELLKERGPMPPHAALAVMEPVLTALSVAHATGMIHRDIKPDNVLISDSHQVKLADFGLVRAIATGVNSGAHTAHDGKVIGTVGYLSPEQVEGKSLHQTSDVYSAGILLYELITGTTPFKEDSPVGTAMARLNRDVPAPSSVISGVPEEIDQLVAQATSRSSETRFSDGTEFLNAVHSVTRDLNLPPFKVPSPADSAVRRALEGADYGERLSWDDESMSTRAVALGTDLHTSEQPGHAQPFSETAHTQLQPADGGYSPYSGTPGVDAHSPAAAYPAGAHAGTGQPGAAYGGSSQGYPPSAYPAGPLHHSGQAAEVAQSHESNHKPALSNRSSGRTVVWILVILALVAAVATGAWWLTSGRYGEVPNVVGMDQASAQATVEEAGFTSDLEEQYSNDTARQAVIGTDPPFGERAPQESQVAVLVSLGKPTVPQPGSADTVATYTQKLEDRTLQAQLGSEVYSDDVPKGKIASTKPASGAEVNTGSTVEVQLSKGPRPVRVPGVKGQSEQRAIETIEAAGLEVGDVVQEFHEQVEAGDAIETRPGSGQEAPGGSEITLVISNAIKVPDITGLSADKAKEKLREAGLNPVDGDPITDEDVEAGHVASQSPAADQLSNPEDDTNVTIHESDAVRVPFVIGSTSASAKQKLEALGLKVKFSSGSSGLVITQSPGLGSRVRVGDTITLGTL